MKFVSLRLFQKKKKIRNPKQTRQKKKERKGNERKGKERKVNKDSGPAQDQSMTNPGVKSNLPPVYFISFFNGL